MRLILIFHLALLGVCAWLSFYDLDLALVFAAGVTGLLMISLATFAIGKIRAELREMDEQLQRLDRLDQTFYQNLATRMDEHNDHAA